MKQLISLILIIGFLNIVFNVRTSIQQNCKIKITNINDSDLFNHRVVVFNGVILNEANQPQTIRNLVVNNLNSANYNTKIDTEWPINTYNQFKGLIKLELGTNKITFSYKNGLTSCNLAMMLSYTNDSRAQPLHLVIVAAKDSPLRYDVNPGEVNDYNSAVAKYRTMAWLWQAFTDDQIYKNGYGRKSFTYETELVNGDYVPKINLIRSDLTLAQIQIPFDPFFASNLCVNAVKASPLNKKKLPNKPLQIACLILDSHKLPNENAVLGHDARGSGWSDDYNFGTFGSHLFYSHPASLKEVKAKFNDIRSINTFYTSNDGGDYRGMVNNVGMGAFLHEVGHSLGLNHNYGIMLRGFEQLNRAFLSVELNTDNQTVSLKTGVDDKYPTWSVDDCRILSVHYLLRFRVSAVKNDDDKSLHLFATSKTSFSLYAPGIFAFVGFWNPDPDAKFINSIRYNLVSQQLSSVEIDTTKFAALLQYRNAKKPLTLIVAFANGRQASIEDIFSKINSSIINNYNFKSLTFGSTLSNQTSFSVDFFCGIQRLSTIRVYYDTYVHGMDFIYSDSSVKSIGYKVGQNRTVDVISKQIRIVRVSAVEWLDSIQFCYSQNDCTQQFGGSSSSLAVFNLDLQANPSNYRISGFTGTSIQYYDANWQPKVINTLAVVYERLI